MERYLAEAQRRERFWVTSSRPLGEYILCFSLFLRANIVRLLDCVLKGRTDGRTDWKDGDTDIFGGNLFSFFFFIRVAVVLLLCCAVLFAYLA